jgi:dTDP-glucose pyrophosphorylase
MKTKNKLIANENMLISRALNLLEKNGKKIIFLTKNNKLSAVFEDSDLRRALIKKKKLDEKIITIANKKPRFIYIDEYSKEKFYKIFQSKNCYAIPIIDRNKKILRIIFSKDFFFKNYEFKLPPALIMAGGIGKRLRPLTLKIPKPLAKYKKTPIIETIIKKLINNNIIKIYVSVKYKKEQIISFIKKKNFISDFEFISEKKFLGTAGSIYFLKKKRLRNLIVLNGDTIVNIDFENFFKYHISNKLAITVATKIIKFKLPYGLVKTKNKYLKSLEEKPEFISSAIIGVYILNESAIKLLNGKKMDMTDLINKCIKQKLKVGYYPVYESHTHITSSKDLKS